MDWPSPLNLLRPKGDLPDTGEGGFKTIMAEITLTAESVSSSTTTLVNATGASAPASARNPRHVLEFEKPLAKLEQQIHELEALQATRQMDYTKELRQLRTNYTSLL